MQRDGALTSLWQYQMPAYEANEAAAMDVVFDVIIVGGGITGITTALQLQKAGKKCLIAEAHTIGFGTSGGTTAHLNTFMDSSYADIEKNFGEQNAQLVLKAAIAAIDLVKNNVDAYNIDCGFSELPGYVYSKDDEQTAELDKIFEASLKAGCDVAYADSIPVTDDFIKALRYEKQAQFHPSQYLYAVAKAFEAAGGVLLQDCRITDVTSENDRLEVESSKGKLVAQHLVYATHIPPGVNLLHFRCAPYRSYVMALTLNDNNYPDALAYDMFDVYHYYRTQEIDGQKYLVAGGEDHKTAHHDNTEECFSNLESYLRERFSIKEVAFKWSSQYFEPTDGLPYIGHLPGNPETVYVATGFGGNGMTYSHVTALLLTDLITNGTSEYAALFSPARVKPVAGFESFVKEAADVVSRFIGDRFNKEKIESLSEILPGEGKLVKYEGESIALFKDEQGLLYAVNPACTHINCTVAWNIAERSWDCPCHGSRFSVEGEMLTGPARKNLERIGLDEKDE